MQEFGLLAFERNCKGFILTTKYETKQVSGTSKDWDGWLGGRLVVPVSATSFRVLGAPL